MVTIKLNILLLVKFNHLANEKLTLASDDEDTLCNNPNFARQTLVPIIGPHICFSHCNVCATAMFH